MTRISMFGLVSLTLLTAACSGPVATSAPPRTVQTSFTSTVGTVGIPASDYRVVVTTSGPCWVASGYGTNPAFSGDLVPAGQSRTFSANNGKVSVQLGSVQVRVSVQIGGQRLPSWRYRPTAAPFTLRFASVS